MSHQAYLDGWYAHMRNQPQDNPYNEVSQAFSHIQWLRGWCARFSAVKHDLDLSLDDKEFE